MVAMRDMDRTNKLSRRGVLAGGGIIAAGSVLAACASNEEENPRGVASPGTDGPTDTVEGAASKTSEELVEGTVSFDGTHQAGVTTPIQAHVNLVGFTFNEGLEAQDVQRLMRVWTTDARMLARGINPTGQLEPEMVLRPANLTFTVGFGPRIFDLVGVEQPDFMQPLPEFSLDQLEDQWGQADVMLQICADDPITLSYATRHMIRSSPTYVKTFWMQTGFAQIAKSGTQRNLFGQLDGSINLREEEDLNNYVWINDGPEWAKDSTVMVTRRIRMDLDEWEMLDRNSRENSIGRTLEEGAPLSGGDEFDDIDMHAVDDLGLPKIDPNSHAARARPADGHPEQVMLRRPYHYDLPPDHPADGQLSNAGQIFICFVADPTTQFVPVQQRLDERDLLNTWITHIGSGIYWIPPGTQDGEYWAQALLEA